MFYVVTELRVKFETWFAMIGFHLNTNLTLVYRVMWWREPSNCLCLGIVLSVLCTHSDCGHLVTEGH